MVTQTLVFGRHFIENDVNELHVTFAALKFAVCKNTTRPSLH